MNLAFFNRLQIKEYNLSEDDVKELRETLLYGIKFIRTLDYYELFEPEMYRIEYIDELGEEHITYYDYLNKTYTEK